MVEDNLAHQKLAGLLLDNAYEFVFASTLEEAMQQMAVKTPDVILLDLNLPDSSGVDTLRSLVKAFPEMPIVVWSGVGEAAEAIHNGADEFLLKDGSFESVSRAIASAIARHKFRSVKQDVSALQKLLESDKK